MIGEGIAIKAVENPSRNRDTKNIAKFWDPAWIPAARTSKIKPIHMGTFLPNRSESQVVGKIADILPIGKSAFITPRRVALGELK